MSRFYSYLNTSVRLLQEYSGEEPLSVYLRNFFRQHKKYGSRDRKQIARLCYNYFRLGKAGLNLPVEERVLTALFLCADKADALTEMLLPKLNEHISKPLSKKIGELGIPFHTVDIFPCREEVSAGLDYPEFAVSFLRQPHLFLRIRPGNHDAVTDKLRGAGLVFEQPEENTLVLENGIKTDNILVLDKEAVVQDYSSQQVGRLMYPLKGMETPDVWDCCAGSGGKSILAFDINETIRLTATDVRESILNNLKTRFKAASISGYTAVITDLTDTSQLIGQPEFDFIIADVPCTGSGTWGRTPEQLYFFEPAEIDRYSALQRDILVSTVPRLKPGGYFLYITCSVFSKENEEQTAFLKNTGGLKLIEEKLIQGQRHGAGTMYAALLQSER